MADDEELQAIRARRMAEMQAQYGGGAGGQSSGKEEEMRRKEEMKQSMLAQILDQGARARLSSIALVKPERAQAVEGLLLRMAQTGQLPGKVGERQLVELLGQFSQGAHKQTTVKFERKRLEDDEDDDY